MPADISQRRSSISSPARSSKKLGAPKAKGAVRAKSGCYTCRIRRKKCDERQDPSGSCETCLRLRLQCLGFGAKRPDYLKDTKNVAVFREKIKSFLASNGMIKGHSSPGTRKEEEEEPAMLRLVEERRYSSSASSPSSESMSPDAHDSYRSHLITSHVRDPEPRYELALPSESYSHHGELWSSPRERHTADLGEVSSQIHQQQLAPDSPPCAPRRLGDHDILNPLMMPPSASSPPTSLLISPAPWHNEPTPVAASYPSYQSLSTQSSYGMLYHQQVVYEEPYEIEDSSPTGPSPSMVMPAYHYGTSNDDLVAYYFHHVVRQQYLLADERVFHDICNMVIRSQSALNAACFLSSLHKQRGVVSNAVFYENVEKALFRPGHVHSEDDIMAGLIVISSFLFKGGRGSWKGFLDVARQWVLKYLSRFRGPGEGLKASAPNVQFVIKTTMWFDVLASITELQPPKLLPIYQDIWGRFSDGYADADPDLSMLRPMGCDNETFLALAEVSHLAWWKETQQKWKRLSVMELIDRGRAIEERYLRRKSIPPLTGVKATDPHRLTTNIFRASTRLYLHSILSGDYPACPEISEAVDETIRCLKAVPPDGNLIRSIVRSVVFSICICGCLTDDAEHRHYLLERLREQERVSDIGNCGAVKAVMQTVWDRRDAMQRQYDARGGPKMQPAPVNWREVMQENNQGLLLLV
ncbi:hypothetical protein OE88DRAFT_1661520 [Heliocybe sulcata]|uniref:Zn(2)-C6 fungal-type domain-containing protein n=1 Tax=Heliocybe sulcata TaxID=5364 RepID=A0A5C3MXK1_9AGAM|nr:hypothetical protein OE88DRAFT_1661520 [Heliocybe sulcata]